MVDGFLNAMEFSAATTCNSGSLLPKTILLGVEPGHSEVSNFSRSVRVCLTVNLKSGIAYGTESFDKEKKFPGAFIVELVEKRVENKD